MGKTYRHSTQAQVQTNLNRRMVANQNRRGTEAPESQHASKAFRKMQHQEAFRQ